LAMVKSLPGNGPSYRALGVRGRVEVRPFPVEAVKGNPTTTVIF